MKNKLVFSRSSLLVSIPVIATSALLCVLAAFFGQSALASVLMFLFLLAAVSRIWAFASARKVSIQVTNRSGGLFPGEETTFDIEVCNNKFLPVVWLEVFFPLSRNLCLKPENSRKPDDWEMTTLEEEGASTQLVGEKRLTMFLWYERLRFSSRWTAERRGVYSTQGWRLRTGDGFGLSQVECLIPREDARQFFVYPRLVRVIPDLFLRNLWNADTGTKGVMEDLTVIRSTRNYMTTDSLKHINWRLAARGLPLSVNVYEDILPKNVHFLLDGESFGGNVPHWEELEETLSILASEFVLLADYQVQCGLSLCRGLSGRAVNLFAVSHVEELLCALAAYEPCARVRKEDGGEFILQQPVFDQGPIYESAQKVGRFYYIAYDTACLGDRVLLRRLGEECTSVLTYREPEPFGEFELVCLSSLREGRAHG